MNDNSNGIFADLSHSDFSALLLVKGKSMMELLFSGDLGKLVLDAIFIRNLVQLFGIEVDKGLLNG